MSYTYKYPMQTVAADAVVFSNKEILLIKRNTDPCKGLYALPGGHLDPTDRNAKETADRELKEETGVDVDHRTVVMSGEVGSFSQIDRDPRGRYISIVYYYLLSERPEIEIDTEEVQGYKWSEFKDIDPKEIAFDHYEIIKKAVLTLNRDSGCRHRTNSRTSKVKSKTEYGTKRYPVDEVLPHIVRRRGIKPITVSFDGDLIKVSSLRLRTFKFKGCKCVGCGLDGTYFLKTRGNPNERWHFNLYGDLTTVVDGEEVVKQILFTKDHIHPKSKGGPNSLNNMQTMCVTCNGLKGCKVQ